MGLEAFLVHQIYVVGRLCNVYGAPPARVSDEFQEFFRIKGQNCEISLVQYLIAAFELKSVNHS